MSRSFSLLAVLFFLTGAGPVLAWVEKDYDDLPKRVKETRRELERRLGDVQTPAAARARIAFRLGRLSEMMVAEPGMDEAQSARLRVLEALRNYRFADAKAALDDLREFPPTPETAWVHYYWLIITEDLATLDTLSNTALDNNADDPAAWLARGELQYRLLNPDEAEHCYHHVLAAFKSSTYTPLTVPIPDLKALAQIGLSRVKYKRDDFQGSFDQLTALLSMESLSDEALVSMSLSLIPLGRTSRAIDLLEEVLQWNPSHEMAHYLLGNGYSRWNYTQLAEKYPRELSDSLILTAPVWVRLGSAWWTVGKFDSASACFRRALELIPEYGRAHNGLAKSLEGLRMRWNIHRAADSARFAEQVFPVVPRIDEFVANWSRLTPRHRKQVALAIEPWKAYLPLLIECGSRYYIKPLQEKLSAGPNLASLKDQRISYDSRLWDDVRGCGGFVTVTGMEDVERSIFSNYNTVLHELTHQVHGVFPPDDVQRILDTFYAAGRRDERGTPTFMSRYQSASVWEYFAEGANAYFSPRRDSYDTREVVRERLFERDSALVALMEHYLPAPNFEACYPVGLVNATEDALEKNDTTRAMQMVDRASARSPHAETVLAELVRVHSILDHDAAAIAYAETLAMQYPTKAGSYTSLAGAHFFSDGDGERQVVILARAVGNLDSSEWKAAQQSLSAALWHIGRYAEAADGFRAILARVHDDPDAWWGLGVALGDAGDVAGADSAFSKAIEKRSGIADLRLDYARVLMAAKELSKAAKQIEEAKLLEPDDEQVSAMEGWLAAEQGDWPAAIEKYHRAMESAPYLRLPAVLRLEAYWHIGERVAFERERVRLRQLASTDIPEWVYVPRKSTHVAGKTWPRFQRELLERVAETP